ncbi:MAG: 4Fe-4S dicluster domain-containing protein [Bacteroidota bacterium]
MSQIDHSLSLASPVPRNFNAVQRIGLASVGAGLALLIVAIFGAAAAKEGSFFWGAITLISLGSIAFSWSTYMQEAAGIKNNGVMFFSETARGTLGWVFGVIITTFYVLLYFYPAELGYSADGNTGLVALFDPLSYLLKGTPASQWFMYGTFYTLSILILGFKYILKYRHSRYHIIRTSSVMFFQTAFAFLIPEFMARLNQTAELQEAGMTIPYYDFKNVWPLNYYNFEGYRIDTMTDPTFNSLTNNLGFIMLLVGVGSVFFLSPLLTYFFGKRWYCSWVCGCGGLAETAGDPFRHLSDKSLKAWRIERWLIHSVLVFIVIMTIASVYAYLRDNGADYWINADVFVGMVATTLLGLTIALWTRKKLFATVQTDIKVVASILMVAITGLTVYTHLFGENGLVFFAQPYKIYSLYAFLIGAVFSGVIGVGFYPLMGSRVWCRFGCPMAAILGLQQRFFSRFRITTNGGQCISCGNCSTYCEMGIDVRAYAQRGQNIVRASCVGCGVCAAVCPRGVLSLENGPNTDNSRMDEVRF